MRLLNWPGRRPPPARGAKPKQCDEISSQLAASLTGVVLVVLAVTSSTQDTSARPGRLLPETENPYCEIKTYKLRGIAEQASSMTDRRGRPVIVVNALTLRDQPNYGRFLLAHECCHHTLGHLSMAKKELGHVGPQPFFYIAPELKRLELEADCCAVRLLRERNEVAGIDAGAAAMARFGDKPTGAYYPTGEERVENIRRCANRDQ